MRIDEIKELHYIVHKQNIESVLKKGIYAYNMMGKIEHESVALPAVQRRRARVILPNGERLHDYANLYFNARNPMMYTLREQHRDLLILSLKPDVLKMKNVYISDRNAARQGVEFKTYPSGLRMIEKRIVMADSWFCFNSQLQIGRAHV
jgi:hypothetical protein